MEVDIQDIQREVLKRVDKKDESEFMKLFVNTQMFVTLVEDFFNKGLKVNEEMLKSIT